MYLLCVDIKPQSLLCIPERKSIVDKTERRHTLYLPNQHLPIYSSTKREDPPAFKCANISIPLADATEIAKQQNFLWVITRLHDTVTVGLDSTSQQEMM